MKKLTSLGLFSYLFILATTSTANPNESSFIDMVVMDQEPHGLIDKEGKPSGVLYDVLSKIQSESGVGNTVAIVPLKRMMAQFNQHERICSLMAGGPDVLNSPDIFDVIESIGFEVSAGILPAKGIMLNDYSNLKDISIAVPLGIEFGTKFDNDKTLHKFSPPNNLNAIKMLERGKIDAIAGAIPMLKYIAKKRNIAADSFDEPFIFFKANVQLVCSSNIQKSDRVKLKNALISLKESGDIQQILDGYFSLD